MGTVVVASSRRAHCMRHEKGTARGRPFRSLSKRVGSLAGLVMQPFGHEGDDVAVVIEVPDHRELRCFPRDQPSACVEVGESFKDRRRWFLGRFGVRWCRHRLTSLIRGRRRSAGPGFALAPPVYHQPVSGGTPSTAGDCIFVVNSGGSQPHLGMARLQRAPRPSPQIPRCCAANDCSRLHPSSPQATECVDAEGDQVAPPPPGRHPQGPEPTEVPALVYGRSVATAGTVWIDRECPFRAAWFYRAGPWWSGTHPAGRLAFLRWPVLSPFVASTHHSAAGVG
jgi:hypothetical protein